MTFFTPAVMPPIIPTVSRRHGEYVVARTVDAGLLPYWRLDLGLIVGTNASLATGSGATAYVVADDSTSDGVSSLPSADVAGPASWLLEIRQRSGLSYSGIARMMGVERRSVYFWLQGRPMSAEHRLNLSTMHELAMRVGSGSPELTAEVLTASSSFIARKHTPSIDRLAAVRVREGSKMMRLPYFNVATLLTTGDDPVETAGDATEED